MQQLNWTQIKNLFRGQWIEIVNFEWDWNRSYPKRACVRNCAPQRRELLSKVSATGAETDRTTLESVILFVGGPEFLIEHDATAATL